MDCQILQDDLNSLAQREADCQMKDDLDWGQHISEISAKATKTFGFLRRDLAFAPRPTIKEVSYKTLVLSSNVQHLFGIPIMKLRLDRWGGCRGQLPGGPVVDEATTVALTICLANLSSQTRRVWRPVWRPAGSSLP